MDSLPSPTERSEIAQQAADELRQFTGDVGQYRVLIGLDGFVDSIIDVVDQRHNAEHYEPMQTMADFGNAILEAAGHSGQRELVVKRQKLGGNGPIMANALARIGLKVSYSGAVGYPNLHPVFQPLADVARVHSFSDPGFTDALEFTDGKLMLGKRESLKQVNWEQLKAVVGVDELIEILDDCVLVGMTNWAMLPNVNTIWQAMVDEVLPKLPERNPRRRAFFDLTDPAMRPQEDLREALQLISRFEAFTKTTLGLNYSEARQVAAALEVGEPTDPAQDLVDLSTRIRRAMKISTVVVHPRDRAAACRADASGKEYTAVFLGPFTERPTISTGAGDHFNAGFSLGLLMGMNLPQALCVGTATSGYYVRYAESPQISQLAKFCADLPPSAEA